MVKRNRKINPDKYFDICKQYEGGASTCKLAKKYNCSDACISSILHKSNVKLRTRSQALRYYSLNENSFKDINANSLYWAGFIAADGNISIKKYNHNILFIELSIKDKTHLIKLKEFLKTNKPLYFRTRKIDFKDKKRTTHKYVRLEISSEQIVNDLKQFGITPNKSLTLQASKIADKSVDFWRGLIDGDGWVSCPKRGNSSYAAIGLLGSEKICQQFCTFIKSNLNIELSYHKKGKVYTISTGFLKARKIIDFIYSNASVYLDRKYKKALSILKKFEYLS